MGSFNVGCGLSNLTIHEGDQVGLVILKEAETFPSRPKGPLGKRFHTYASDLYLPYLPPVYGTYDDYGHIADLQPSGTTDAIERIFRRDALDVINAVGQDRDLYDTYGALAHLYMKPEAREALSSFGKPDHEVLMAFGFEETDRCRSFPLTYEYGSHGLYSYVADDLALPAELTRQYYDIVRLEDGEVLHRKALALNGMKDVLSSFAALTGELPGFEEEDHEAVREVQGLSGMFFLQEIYSGMSEKFAEDEYYLEGIKHFNMRLERAMASMAKDGLARYNSDLSDIQRSVGMRGSAWANLTPLVGTAEYGQIASLLSLMTGLNRMFMPSFSGEQFGNDQASIHLNLLTDSILSRRAEEWEEDYDEDYDEDEE